jgi:LemA protein
MVKVIGLYWIGVGWAGLREACPITSAQDIFCSDASLLGYLTKGVTISTFIALMTIAIIAIVAAAVIIAGLAISSYNRLIDLKNKVAEAEGDIAAQLKRRYDLIPNIVEAVKGAKSFEQETLEKVIKARQQAIDISGLTKEKVQAENMLSGALRQLFALSENYPDLKSNQNFLHLQEELTNTEDRILASRRFYNTVVADYNTVQDQFPTLIFKGLAGATPADQFELEDPSEAKAPKVEFE